VTAFTFYSCFLLASAITMVHFNVGFQHFNSFADITLSLAKTLDKMGIPISVEPSKIASHLTGISTESAGEVDEQQSF
jgi:hypothetical protein